MEKIVIPKGIKIGHAQDNFTGISVIISDEGVVCGVSVRGGAPGTHETDLLKSEKAMQKINAIALCGGSAYGLGAIAGVMEYLKENNIGYKINDKIVPIVSGAVIYDLNDKEYHYPDKEMGYSACKNAKEDNDISGKVGAGKGATVGKIRGIKNASESGLGIATVKVQGITITAIMVVNALGDVINPETRKILAGAKDNKGGFLDTTNLEKISHNGLAKTISPVHTDYDGDSLFVLATGKKKVFNNMLLQVGAVEAVGQAIINSVKKKA